MFYFNSSDRSDRTTRRADLKLMSQDYKSADKAGRKQINEAVYKIQNESGKVRGMRRALAKEHRAGNTENVKDIHDYTKDKSKFK